MQYIFFIIFIISVLIFGSITVGPFSIRVYMTVFMLAYLVMHQRNNTERMMAIRRDYIKLFLLCIFALFVSLFINGGLIAYGFWVRCLAYYLVCIVAYFAVDICVKKEEQYHILSFVLSLIILLDSGVTLLQYFNNPIGWGIGAIFSDVEDFASFLDEHESFAGVSKIPGIFGHPVSNGFFLTVTTSMLLIGIDRKKIFSTLYYTAVISVSLVSCIFLQQRAAFFLLLIFIAYNLFKTYGTKPNKIVIPAVLIGALIIIIAPIFDDFDFSRLTSSDNRSRTSVWLWASGVIMQNPLFGDIVAYNKAAEYSAHNILIDSLIDSGLLGFIPLMILYFKTIKDALKIMLHTKNRYARVFSYSVLTCMAMGMFHNTSYLTGDVIIFIVLALMFKAQKMSQSPQTVICS